MTQKEIAIQCLEKLNIYGPYIRKFKSKAGIPCFFENFAGFYADQEPELWNKIREVEQEYGCLVYAITHEILEFGECYDFLIVTDYIEEWDYSLTQDGNEYNAFAYVWNKDCEWCSEFGTVGIKSFGGGIRRIA
jgi:hypothetical protein